MKLTSILRSKNWYAINRQLLRHMDANAALLLSVLCDEYEYYAARGELTSDGYFFCTQEKVEELLFFKRRVQEGAFKALKELQLLSIKVKGIPAKRHIKFSENADDVLMQMISDTPHTYTNKNVQNVQTALHKNAKQESTKTPNYILRTEDKELKTNDVVFPIGNTPSGDGQQAARAVGEFSEFDDWAKANELFELLKFEQRFTKEKVAQKRKAGEGEFYEVCCKINDHALNNPKWLAERVDLPKTFATFARNQNKQPSNAQNAPKNEQSKPVPIKTLQEIFCAFWGEITGGLVFAFGKQEKINLKELCQKLKDGNAKTGKAMSESELLEFFLSKLPPNYRHDEAASPYLLNREYNNIVREMKRIANGGAARANGKVAQTQTPEYMQALYEASAQLVERRNAERALINQTLYGMSSTAQDADKPL